MFEVARGMGLRVGQTLLHEMGNSIWKSFCGKLEDCPAENLIENQIKTALLLIFFAQLSDELFFGSDVKSYFSSELIATSVFFQSK